MPRISVVIPAFNEEQFLPALLDSIDLARERYEAGAEEIEIIVADNASTDGTAILARARGCRVVSVERRSIAAARNGGARVAKGKILAFVDADSQIHPATFNAIELTLASGKVIVGATGARWSRMSAGIAFTFLPALLFLYLAGFDTGVVFCRRADWESVGGYEEDRLFAEDIRFLIAIKRLGRTRGQRFARAKGIRAMTSARKFDRHGDWHYLTTVCRLCRGLLLDRPSLKRFVQTYWYEDRQ